MRRKFLLASHGKLSEGMYDSVKFIIGDQDNISILCAYVNNKKSIQEQIKEVVHELKKDEELIVVTDIFGGSVNNEFMKYINNKNLYIISGMCLPLVIKLLITEEEDTDKLIESAIEEVKKSIKYCNKTFVGARTIKDEEF